MPMLIDLPEPLEKGLALLTDKTGQPASFFIAQAVENYIEDIRDHYLARDSLHRIKTGTEKTYLLSDIVSELGLGD